MKKANHLKSSINAKLNTRPSQVLPMNRFPIEILTIVFDLLVPRPLSSEVGTWTFDPAWDWDWTVITRVCGYWRRTAFGTPLLWTYFDDFRHTDRTLHFLARSKDAPLKIYFSTSDRSNLSPNAVHQLLTILQNLNRIEQLHLYLAETYYSAGALWKSVLGMLEQPAPKLTSFSLLAYPNGPEIIPSLFFSNSTPALNFLQFSGVHVGTDQNIIQSLTELCLEDTEGLSQSIFYSILESNPSLESLKLKNVQSVAETTVDKNGYHLPSLRHISIEGESMDVDSQTRWLGNVELHDYLNWSIHRISEVSPSVDEEIRNNIPGFLRAPIRCEKLEIIISRDALYFNSESCTDGEGRAMSRAQLYLYWRGSGSAEVICGIINMVVQSGYWRTAEEVFMDVRYLDGATDDLCRAVWAEYKSVRSIKISLRTDYIFGKCFASILAEQPSVISKQMRTLGVACHDSYSKDKQADLVQNLKHSIKKRKEVDMGLSDFSFFGKFALNNSDVAEISQQVDKFKSSIF